ncbi:MAG: ABC transporter substrate-binding protein [Bacteroidota bacterium]
MIKNAILFCLSIVIIQISSCNSKSVVPKIDQLFENAPDSVIISRVTYAIGFDIYEVDNIKKLVIYNPQNSTEVLNTYYFADSTNYNKYKPSPSFFKIPLDSVAVFSATQLNAFSKLGILNKVVAISESEYIQNPNIQALYSENKIVELASNGNFYLEKTLKLDPEIIFYSPYNLAQKHPLSATNITMIPFFDFMESNPLGRAEWVKFSALFFNKEDEASLMFDTIVSKYLNFKKLALTANENPTVFSDKYYSGQWFMSGGKSYIAKLFNDAGTDYLWKDNQNRASINLDFEVVISKAQNADFWRIVGTYPDGFSYEKLGSENELYANFEAFKNRKVIFCDSKKSTYFETGTLEPHLLLADLIYAFHPGLLQDYHPKYYFLKE